MAIVIQGFTVTGFAFPVFADAVLPPTPPLASPSRLITFTNAVVEAIKLGWDPLAPPAEVKRRWANKEKENDLSSLTGRKVWVIPERYSDEPLTRKRDTGEYGLTVDVIERYVSEVPGEVPDEWVDALVVWVQNEIWDKLTDPRAAAILDGFYPDIADLVQVVNKPMLVENKTFWSRTEMSFKSV